MSRSRWSALALVVSFALIAGYRYLHREPPPFVAPNYEVVVVGSGGVVGFAVEVSAGRISRINDRPARIIRGPSTGLRNPIDVMIDSGGSIYVVNAGDELNPDRERDPGAAPFRNPSITVYSVDADGDAAPARTMRPIGDRPDRNLVWPTGIVWRPIPDHLFVVDAGAHAIRQFLRDPVDHPVKQIAGDQTGIGGPSGLAIGVDRGGAGHEFYVVEPAQNAILVFRDSVRGNVDANVPPVRTITGLVSPSKAAVDEDANLYVVNRGRPHVALDASVMVFAPGAGSNALPIRTIRPSIDDAAGRNDPADVPPPPNLSQPYGIAVGWGSIFVTDTNALKVFAPDAQGADRPSMVIANEEIGDPIAVAVRTRSLR